MLILSIINKINSILKQFKNVNARMDYLKIQLILLIKLGRKDCLKSDQLLRPLFKHINKQ